MLTIEEFVNEEVAQEDAIDREQALVIAERMGLSIQIEKRKSGEAQVLKEMTLEQKMVFDFIAPVEVELDKYTFDAMPLRALEIAEIFRPQFELLVVRHPKTAREVDPILLGVKTDPVNKWRKAYYPLCRWGDPLEQWDLLVKKAFRHFRQQRISELRRIVAEAGAVIKVLTEDPHAGSQEHILESFHLNPTRILK